MNHSGHLPVPILEAVQPPGLLAKFGNFCNGRHQSGRGYNHIYHEGVRYVGRPRRICTAPTDPLLVTDLCMTRGGQSP